MFINAMCDYETQVAGCWNICDPPWQNQPDGKKHKCLCTTYHFRICGLLSLAWCKDYRKIVFSSGVRGKCIS